jgi:hypothetical protein
MAMAALKSFSEARRLLLLKPREYSEESAAYDMRVFLLHLKAIGPEFKNFRKHLLDNLPGNKAWKHGRPNA